MSDYKLEIDQQDIENQKTKKNSHPSLEFDSQHPPPHVKLDQQYQPTEQYYGQQQQPYQQQQAPNNIYQAEPINPLQPNVVVQHQQMIIPIIPALNQYPGGIVLGVDSQTRELINMSAQEKLINVTKVNIRADRIDACSSDLICLGPFATKFIVSTQNLFNASYGQPLFEIELEQPGCVESKLDGKFTNLDPHYPELHEMRREKIYDVVYNRSCCFLKYLSILFSCMFIIVFLLFYVLAALFPSSSKLKKNGMELYNYKFKCCDGDIIIYEGKKKVKYILKSRKGDQRILVDAQGNAVQGFRQQSIYSDGPSINVSFPEEFLPDDKAAVIFAACKSIA